MILGLGAGGGSSAAQALQLPHLPPDMGHMANGLPDEFPFNRRRYLHPGPDAPAEQQAQEEALDIELTADEMEEVAQAAKAATILTAPLPASPVSPPALQRSPSL